MFAHKRNFGWVQVGGVKALADMLNRAAGPSATSIAQANDDCLYSVKARLRFLTQHLSLPSLAVPVLAALLVLSALALTAPGWLCVEWLDVG